MGNENEFEFVPLAPITHNSLPEEMKDFVSSYGMLSIMPRRGFQSFRPSIMGQVIDLKVVEDGIECKETIKRTLQTKDKVDDCIGLEELELKEDSSSESEKVERVLMEIENNNSGVLKFLQVNGMPYDKAKKFIKRIVRLSLRYDK